MRKRFVRHVALPLVGSLVLPAGAAVAGGLFVGDPGSQAMERGGAFVAKADDPTALKINPAGLMKTKRFELYLGSNFLDGTLSYQRSGVYKAQPGETVPPGYVGSPYPEVSNSDGFQPVPFLGAAQRWKDLAFGEAVFAPQGVVNRDFNCGVSDNGCQVAANGAPSPQRYDVVSQNALIVFPSIAVAYGITDDLDIGVRASWGVGNVKARSFVWGVPNAEEDPTKDGDFALDVKDNFIPEWGAGILYRPTSYLEFGAAYSSEVHVNATGTGTAQLGSGVGAPIGQDFIEPVPDEDAKCATGGTPSALKACLSLEIPQVAQFGGRVVFRDGAGREQGDVEADVRWENWKAASDTSIVVDGRDNLLHINLQPSIVKHGFQDVWSVRVGGAYSFDLDKTTKLALRAGAAIDTAAAPTSWTRVDMDGMARQSLALGAALDFSKYWRVDAGFSWVHEGNVTVTDTSTETVRTQPDAVQPSSPATNQSLAPFNEGLYKGGYVIGMLGVTASW